MNSAANPPNSGLGRGLNELMPAPKGIGSVAAPAGNPIPGNERDRPLAYGLNTLLKGNGTQPAEARRIKAGPPGEPSRRSTPALKAGLVCADFLLVLQAALIVLGRERTLGLAETILCAVSIAVGAWLSVLAIHLHSQNH